MTLAAIEWRAVLGTTPLEITATLCAIAGVILIARQNRLGWPLGMLWAGISAWLAWTEWHLVSDAILYASYLPIQIYCWIVWKRGDAENAPLRPSWMENKARLVLIASLLLSIALWGYGVLKLSAVMDWIPAPALLWRDAASTVLNYFAQFLQAKKRMENWVLWLLVNVLGIHIYWVKEVPIYSVQYVFFLGLGIFGWVSWHRSMKEKTA